MANESGPPAGTGGGGGAQVAGLDVVVTAPGAQQARNDAVGALTDIATAAKANAAAMDGATSAADRQRQAFQNVMGSTQGLTAAQQMLQERIDALAQSSDALGATNNDLVSAMQKRIATERQLQEQLGATGEQLQQLDQLTASLTDRQRAAQEERQQQIVQGQQMADAIARERRMLMMHTQALEINEQQTRAMVIAHTQALAINEALDAGIGRLSGSMTGGSYLARQFSMGLSMIGAEALGATSQVGRLADLGVMFTAGIGAAIAVSVVLAGIAFAYEKITADAREAKKAADDFAQSNAGRLATTQGLGPVSADLLASGGQGLQIPALTADAQKASDAVRGLENELQHLANGPDNSGAGGFIVGGPSQFVKQLAKDLLTGGVNADEFNTRIANMPKGTAWQEDAQHVAQWGSQLLAARQQLDQLNATVEQAQAVQRFYTQELNASGVEEGQLLEKIQQRQAVLRAFQSGGIVAGKSAEDSASAFDAAAKMYEDYAKSGKDATLATLAFQDAREQQNPIAEAFYNEQKKLLDLNTQIARAQQQTTSGNQDTNRFTALTDQIQRLEESAQAFGKDASINTRIQAVDDQLDQFEQHLQQQLATGKLTEKSYADQSAAVEEFRQRLYAAGQALHDAADGQISEQIQQQYDAQKALNDAVADGTGSTQELSAAKQAQLEIDRDAKTLGHDLSDVDQQRIRDRYALAAALNETETTQGMERQAQAIQEENDAMRAGASDRAKYAADLKEQRDLLAAQTIADPQIRAARIQAITDLHDATIAHGALTAAEAASTKATAAFTSETQRLAQSFEKDLLGAIDRFSTNGINSFRSFITEVESLTTRLVEQIDSGVTKLDSDVQRAIAAHANGSEITNIEREISDLQKLLAIAGPVSAALSGGMVGYGIGEQTGNSTEGILGGAAAGALAGSVFGPLGTAAGALAGAAGGLFGAADAQKKAAAAMQAAAMAFNEKEAAFVNAGSGSTIAQQLQEIDNERIQLKLDLNTLVKNGGFGAVGGPAAYNAKYDALDAASAAQKQKIADDFWDGIGQKINALSGPAGDYQNQLDAIQKEYTENIANATALHATQAQLAEIEQLRDTELQKLNDDEAEQQRQITASLDAREAAARGDKDLADALTRRAAEDKEVADAEQQGYTAAEIARLKAIQALEDEAAAQQKAADAAERYTKNVADLNSQFLSLMGDTDQSAMASLLEQQREARDQASTSGATPLEVSMLDVVQLLQRGQLEAQQDAKAQQDVLNAQLKTAQDQLSTAKTQLQTDTQASDTLSKYRDSLSVGNLSALSPQDQLAAARAQLQALYTRAAGGDASAASDFTSAANTFLTQSRGFNASGPGYATDFASVQQMATALANQYANQKTLDQQQVDLLQQQVDQLNQQLAALQDANAIATATQQKVVAELQAQRDATLAPNAALIDQLTALSSTFTGVGRDIVNAEQGILVGDRDALTTATQNEIAAIQSGASLQQVSMDDMIRQLTAQKTAQDDYYAKQLIETAKTYGADSPQVQAIRDLQDEYDKKVKDQIDAINANGGSIATAIAHIALPATGAGTDTGTGSSGIGVGHISLGDAPPAGPGPSLAGAGGSTQPVGAGGNYVTYDNSGQAHLFDPYNSTTYTFGLGQFVTPWTDPLGDTYTGVSWVAAGQTTGLVRPSIIDAPAFAAGGDFGGGLRLVGERGPELEVTGASRIVSNTDLGAALMAGTRNGEAQLAELKAQTKRIDEGNQQLRTNMRVLQAGFLELVKRFDDQNHELEQQTKEMARQRSMSESRRSITGLNHRT